MLEQIGVVAGNVWSALNENGEMTVAQLKKELDEQEFFIVAALGWLAREDKVEIYPKGKGKAAKLK